MLVRGSEEGAARGVKWPKISILWWNGKKVCGILTETEHGIGLISITFVIGVGINVRRSVFLEEYFFVTGTVIEEQSGFRISRSQLIADIMELLRRIMRSSYKTHARLTYFLSAKLLVEPDRESLPCWIPRENSAVPPAGINDQGELLVERQEGVMGLSGVSDGIDQVNQNTFRYILFCTANLKY